MGCWCTGLALPLATTDLFVLYHITFEGLHSLPHPWVILKIVWKAFENLGALGGGSTKFWFLKSPDHQTWLWCRSLSLTKAFIFSFTCVCLVFCFTLYHLCAFWNAGMSFRTHLWKFFIHMESFSPHFQLVTLVGLMLQTHATSGSHEISSSASHGAAVWSLNGKCGLDLCLVLRSLLGG